MKQEEISACNYHADGSRGNRFFTGVCLSVCLSAPYLKTALARITKLDIEMFHHKSRKLIYFGSKGQRSKS